MLHSRMALMDKNACLKKDRVHILRYSKQEGHSDFQLIFAPFHPSFSLYRSLLNLSHFSSGRKYSSKAEAEISREPVIFCSASCHGRLAPSSSRRLQRQSNKYMSITTTLFLTKLYYANLSLSLCRLSAFSFSLTYSSFLLCG